MKKLTILIAFLTLTTIAFGQRITLGENQLNAGLGFNSGAWEMPIYVGFERGVYENISAGAFMEYATADFSYGNFKNEGSLFRIGARGDYHFNTVLEIPDQWDVYAGLKLSYRNISYDNDWSDGYNDYDDSGIELGGQIGARYYFNERVAVNLEFAIIDSDTGGNIGVSYKF